jgi:hypothetical protein
VNFGFLSVFGLRVSDWGGTGQPLEQACHGMAGGNKGLFNRGLMADSAF